MNFPCLFFHLLQIPVAPISDRDLAIATTRGYVVVESPAGPDMAAIRRRVFVERFNRLVFAVEDFSKSYNKGKGMIWPIDKAKSLQKAMKSLQASEPALEYSARPLPGPKP